MTRELFWLSCTVILTGILWIPYIINRCQVRGLSGAMGAAASAGRAGRSGAAATPAAPVKT